MRHARCGVALVLVLLALATLGATAVALLAAAAALRDDARGSLAALQARALAASAVAGVWGDWDGAARVDDSVGAVDESMLASAAAVATVQRARLHDQLWWVAADARALMTMRQRPVRHAAALALHLAVPLLEPPAAVSTAGSVTLVAGALVTGGDSVPPSWPCRSEMGGASPSYALLRASGGSLLAPAPSIRGADVSFVPGTAGDPRPAWERARSVLVAVANVYPVAGTPLTPTPTARDGQCTDDATSWGEPDRAAPGVPPCRRRWVVVHARHPLTVTGGRAQGILLSDSALEFAAGARFTGLILARGAVHLSAAAVVGAVVMLGDSGGSPAPLSLSAGATVSRSRCAVLAALLGGPTLAPADPGGWLTLW